MKTQPQLSNIDKRLDNKFNRYVEESVYKSKIEEFTQTFSNVFQRIANANDDLSNMKSYSDIIDAKLDTKVDITDFNEETKKIWKQFDMYCEVEELKQLESKIGNFQLKIHQNDNFFISRTIYPKSLTFDRRVH